LSLLKKPATFKTKLNETYKTITMKILQTLFIAGLLVGFTACKNDTKKTDESPDNTTETIVEEAETVVTKTPSAISSLTLALEPKSGSNASGKVGILVEDGKVTLEAQIFGLKEGTHAIHIHEKADCSSEDGKSSGGHWNPTFAPHGKWGDEAGYHRGDIGNFEVGPDGNGKVTITTDEWCLGCGDEKKDILGKAIIVHAEADDFTSQPSGAAGARVSCGGIIQ
jgi:Cu-Zn family superoxide dismutase